MIERIKAFFNKGAVKAAGVINKSAEYQLHIEREKIRAELIGEVRSMINSAKNNIDNEVDEITGPDYRTFTLNEWRYAMQHANQPYNRNFSNSWVKLFDIFSNVVEDANVAGAINLLTEGLKSKDFYFCDENGEKLDELTALMDQQGFYDFMDEIVQSWLWGFSLIKIESLDFSDFTFKVGHVNRKHVRPDLGGVVRQEYDETTNIFWDKRPYKDWNMFSFFDNLGALNPVVRWYIYKTSAAGLWDKYLKTFGRPHVIAHTSLKDSLRKENMINALKGWIKNPWMVVDTDDVIDTTSTTSTTGSEYFKDMVNLADEQMNKALLTGVGTMDNSTNRSVSEVHERGKNNIIASLARVVRFMTNKDLLPRLRNFGFPIPQGAVLKFDESEKLTTKERAEVIKILCECFDIDEQTASEYVGIEVKEKEEQEFNPQKNNFEND